MSVVVTKKSRIVFGYGSQSGLFPCVGVVKNYQRAYSPSGTALELTCTNGIYAGNIQSFGTNTINAFWGGIGSEYMQETDWEVLAINNFAGVGTPNLFYKGAFFNATCSGGFTSLQRACIVRLDASILASNASGFTVNVNILSQNDYLIGTTRLYEEVVIGSNTWTQVGAFITSGLNQTINSNIPVGYPIADVGKTKHYKIGTTFSDINGSYLIETDMYIETGVVPYERINNYALSQNYNSSAVGGDCCFNDCLKK
jgi:hypothetical protein